MNTSNTNIVNDEKIVKYVSAIIFPFIPNIFVFDDIFLYCIVIKLLKSNKAIVNIK